MLRTQIQLRGEQVALLKSMAAARHVSMAELIRQAVDGLVRSGVAIDEEQRRKRAISAAGRFRSGVRDLSSRHDKHLVETFKK